MILDQCSRQFVSIRRVSYLDLGTFLLETFCCYSRTYHVFYCCFDHISAEFSSIKAENLVRVDSVLNVQLKKDAEQLGLKVSYTFDFFSYCIVMKKNGHGRIQTIERWHTSPHGSNHFATTLLKTINY